LAIVFYERLLPGTQVVNRLTDLGYRVSTAHVASEIPQLVENQKPMVVVADLVLRAGDFITVITELKRSAATNHVPVLGFCDPKKHRKLADAAVAAGANMVAAEKGILDQLPRLLDHVLAVE
jgi:DNA-binding response OmpR family regulator